MAEWTPATLQELQRYLDSGIAELGPADRQLYEQYRVDPSLVFINRPGTDGTERVYVVACKRGRVVVFEDVEDLFAIGTLVSDDRVEIIGWFLNLCAAVRDLAAG